MEQKIFFTGRDMYNIVLLFLSLLTESTNQILILAQSSSDNPKTTKIASFKKSIILTFLIISDMFLFTTMTFVNHLKVFL